MMRKLVLGWQFVAGTLRNSIWRLRHKGPYSAWVHMRVQFLNLYMFPNSMMFLFPVE